MNLNRSERLANQAIKNLRAKKLSSGLTFMINSDKLPPDQCYIEHPEGYISLVVLSRKINEFKVIEKYSEEESDQIRKKFRLA